VVLVTAREARILPGSQLYRLSLVREPSIPGTLTK
jgi:hypothetical protein